LRSSVGSTGRCATQGLPLSTRTYDISRQNQSNYLLIKTATLTSLFFLSIERKIYGKVTYYQNSDSYLGAKMPEISLLGWFHTIIAVIALITGFYSLAKYKVILLEQLTGKIYLICTLLAALTALAIFRHGGFGAAHGLAILTLAALLVGILAAKFQLFGKLSAYIQAASFSATFLFHMIPAITDGLMRLPIDAPIVTSIEDPLLKGFYLTFLIIYIVGLAMQIRWLRTRNNTGKQ